MFFSQYGRGRAASISLPTNNYFEHNYDCTSLNHFVREQHFRTTWTDIVKRSKSSLDPDDYETVDTFKTWEDLTQWLINSAPTSLSQIRLALNHLRTFAKFFELHLNPSLDASYLWGSLTCLLQVSSPPRNGSCREIPTRHIPT